MEMEPIKKIRIQADGLVRSFFDMAKRVGIQLAPTPPGKLFDEEEKLMTLHYLMSFGGNMRANRMPKIPFGVIENSDLWLRFIESTLKDDMSYAIHQCIMEERKPNKPQFQII